MTEDRPPVDAERPRRRKLPPFTFALLGAVSVALSLAAAASAAPVGVVSVSCGALHGCPLTKPAVWTPDRRPEMGYGVEFRSIRWRGWGGPTARGRATTVACPDGGLTDGSECVESRASFVVYDVGWAPVGSRHVYRCLWITQIEPSLMVDVATDISAYDTLDGAVHCRARA